MSSEITDIKVNQKVMEERHNQLIQTISSLEKSIEKITEVSSNVAKLLAVYDERLQNQEKNVEKIAENNKQSSDIIHDRINKMKEEYNAGLEGAIKRGETWHEENLSRFSKIEKWIFTVSGGGIVIGFLLSKFINYIF
jgi:methyl-accepting chemotaxis protein